MNILEKIKNLFKKQHKHNTNLVEEIETEFIQKERYRNAITETFCLYLENTDFSNNYEQNKSSDLIYTLDNLEFYYRDLFESYVVDESLAALLLVDALENIDFRFALLEAIELYSYKHNEEFKHKKFYCRTKHNSTKTVNIQTKLFIHTTEAERLNLIENYDLDSTNKSLYISVLNDFIEEIVSKYIDSINFIDELDRDFVNWVLYEQIRKIDFNTVFAYDFDRNFSLETELVSVEDLIESASEEHEQIDIETKVLRR